MSSATIVMNLTGCTEQEAETALTRHEGDTLAAVDSLITKPAVAGEKFIPGKPKVDDGLTEEVRANLLRARRYADMLSSSSRNDLRQNSGASSAASGAGQQQKGSQ